MKISLIQLRAGLYAGTTFHGGRCVNYVDVIKSVLQKNHGVVFVFDFVKRSTSVACLPFPLLPVRRRSSPRVSDALLIAIFGFKTADGRIFFHLCLARRVVGSNPAGGGIFFPLSASSKRLWVRIPVEAEYFLPSRVCFEQNPTGGEIFSSISTLLRAKGWVFESCQLIHTPMHL